MEQGMKKNLIKYLGLFFFSMLLVLLIDVWEEFGPRKQSMDKDLRISEICSDNNTVIYDDNGEFHDYVELFNMSDESVDLSEYYLSDSGWYLRKYELSGMLSPNCYAVIFINKDLSGFGIGSDEAIYLSHRSKGIIDSVTVPNMKSDRSLSLYNVNLQENEQDGIAYEWCADQIPTPGIENLVYQEKQYAVDEGIQLVFSRESGFYPEGFELSISASEECEIYYTLDGSVPTEESTRYEEKIKVDDVSSNDNTLSMRTDISPGSVSTPDYNIEKCCIIRAVAITSDGRRSKEKVASFFIDYENRYGFQDIYVASLVTDPDNLFSKERGIYVLGNLGEKSIEEASYDNPYSIVANYTREGKGWRRDCNIQIFDVNHKSVLQRDIQIGIHGGYSTYYAQKGFNLFAPSNVLPSEYVFEFPTGEKYSSLMLRPGGIRDWKVTQFRDVLNAELISERNLTTLQGIPCQVFVDGEYWGLYNLQERIDNGLIAQKFGIDWNNLIVAKRDQIVEGNDSDYSYYESIVDYAESNDLSKDYFYKRISEMIDIQSFIEYHCFEIYVANVDSIANNYACWRVRETSDKPYHDGKWRWIIYDTDDSTGLVENGMSDANVDSFVDGHWKEIPLEDPLLVALLENETFRKQFKDTMLDMAESDFDMVRVDELLNEYTDKYMEASVASRKRFGKSKATEKKYLESVSVVRNFFANRKEYVLKYMAQHLGE